MRIWFILTQDPKPRLHSLLSASTSNVSAVFRNATQAVVNSRTFRRASIAVGLDQVLSPKPDRKDKKVSFRRAISQTSMKGIPKPVPNIIVEEPEKSSTIAPDITTRTDTSDKSQDLPAKSPNATKIPNNSEINTSDNDTCSGTSPDVAPDISLRVHPPDGATASSVSDPTEKPATTGGTLTVSDLERLRSLAQHCSSFEDEGDEEETLCHQSHLPKLEPEQRFLEHLVDLWPGWEKIVPRLRYTAAGVLFIIAALTLVLTLMPTGSAEGTHGLESWSIKERALWPYIELKHLSPPPT